MCFKKTIVFLTVMLVLFPVNQLFAQMPKEQVTSLSALTGLSESEVKTTGLKLEELLMVYCIAKKTGNPIRGIIDVRKSNWKEGEVAADIWKPVYSKYSIQGDKQSEITGLYNSLRGEIFKTKFEKADYAGVKKEVVAEIISNKTSVSKSAVMEYGFSSGLSVNDILMACEVAAKTGNSLQDIVRLRKEGGTDFSAVYKKYSVPVDRQQEITAKYNADVGELSKGITAKKRQKQGLTRDMQKKADIIQSVTAVSKDKILDFFRQGFSEADLIRASAVTNKIGADFTNVMKLLDEGGWSKVYNNYAISSASVDGIVGAVNNKIKEQPK